MLKILLWTLSLTLVAILVKRLTCKPGLLDNSRTLALKALLEKEL